MTLPYDIARCFGVGSPQCYDCLRRTEPGNPDGRQLWTLPNIAPSEPCALRIVPEEEEARET